MMMEAMMKKAIDGGKVVFTFDGGLEPLVFNPGQAHPVVRAYAELHGWLARLGDAAAIMRQQKDGSVITVTEDMRRAAVLELVQHYHAGTAEWGVRARAAVREHAGTRALADKRGITYAEAEAVVADAMLGLMADD